MNDDVSRALSPIGLMLIDLFARHLATLSVLRSLPTFDEQKYQEELRKAQAQLKGIPGVANLRNQTSAQELRGIEHLLQTLLLKN